MVLQMPPLLVKTQRRVVLPQQVGQMELLLDHRMARLLHKDLWAQVLLVRMLKVKPLLLLPHRLLSPLLLPLLPTQAMWIRSLLPRSVC
jgi:hypothetical protein